MKCMTCGGPMTSARENYKYLASGLPNVTLSGVRVNRCKKCGEHEVEIPRIEELHQVLAHAVIMKHARLAPEEVRFLRSYLGWSGVDFAKRIGATPTSVSRWETGKEPIGPGADRALRLMVTYGKPVASYPLDELLDKITDDKKPAVRVTAKMSMHKGWQAAAA